MQVAGAGRERTAIETPYLTNHVIICGYGSVGRTIAWFLGELAIPYMVTDLDPITISELQDRGVPCVYGDAGNPNVLHQAGIRDASILVLAVADPVAVRLALDHARRLNPNLDIIARAHNDSELQFLQGRGVSEVVQPETEAGIELVRHTLCRLGLPEEKIAELVASQRKVCPL